MTTIKNIMVRSMLMAAILFGAISCTAEHAVEPETRDEMEVKFAVKMPSQKLPTGTKSTSYTYQNENDIKTVYLLVFKVNDDNTETFEYSRKAKVTSNSVDGNFDRKTFSASLVKGKRNEVFRIVIMANLPDENINNLKNIVKGTLKETVTSLFKFEAGSGFWYNGTDAQITPIPMWGETEKMEFGVNLLESIKVKLIRMVARIDVVVADEIKDDFKLQSMRIFRYPAKGILVPSNWNNITNKATVPTLESPYNPIESAAIIGKANPDDQNIIARAYMFEAPAGNKTELDKHLTIIIGGIYKNDLAPTFYRLDLVDNDGETYIPLLRNHLYRININKITGSGFMTSETAARTEPLNVKANTLTWDYNELDKVTFDDQYSLGVNEDLFEFTKDKVTAAREDNKLSILTDYPFGWNANIHYEEGYNGEDWLSLSATSSMLVQPNIESIAIFAKENNDTSRPTRTGYITIHASNLTKVIKVVQKSTIDLGIEIVDANGKPVTNIVFDSYLGQTSVNAQTFKVIWKPGGTSTCKYQTINLGQLQPFSYSTSNDIISNSGVLVEANGEHSFTIKPNLMTSEEISWQTGNPMLERGNVIEFVVTNGTETIRKSVNIQQINYGFVPIFEDGYILDGKTYNFIIKSNADWKITKKSETIPALTDLRNNTGSFNITTGQTVQMQLADKASKTVYGPATITFEIESTNPEKYFAPQTFTVDCAGAIIQESANSYYVAPNGNALVIPVDRANQTGILPTDVIKASDQIGAKFLWTDNPGGIGMKSSIRKMSTYEKDGKKYIVILPGTDSELSPGNAIVAVTVGGAIKWSWHIWVTGYTPTPVGNPQQWMDRNLGALANNMPNILSMGLTYQWGRKDPFPGTSETRGLIISQLRPMYDKDGNILSGGLLGSGITSSSEVVAANLANAIANPMTYYISKAPAYDWYTNDKDLLNHNLWNTIDNKKGIFDPCPYGWRVPIKNDPDYYWSQTATISHGGGNGTTNPKFISQSGVIWGNKGGNYPATGTYTGGTNISGVGTTGSYATGNAVEGTSHVVYRYYFVSGSSSPFNESSATTRQSAYSVRCVRDKDVTL